MTDASRVSVVEWAGAAGLQEARFDSNRGRLAHAVELDLGLARWTAARPRDELVARLRAAEIAFSPVLSVEEQWRDRHYAARDIKQRVAIPYYGEEDLFRAPWRFSDFAPSIDHCGPTLGQHNDYVFGELLGLSRAEITDLKATGVIATPLYGAFENASAATVRLQRSHVEVSRSR